MAVAQGSRQLVVSPSEALARASVQGDALSWRDRSLVGEWHDGTYLTEEEAQVSPVVVDLGEVTRGYRGHQPGGVVLSVRDGSEFLGAVRLSDEEAQALALALLARVQGHTFSGFADRLDVQSLVLPPAQAAA